VSSFRRRLTLRSDRREAALEREWQRQRWRWWGRCGEHFAQLEESLGSIKTILQVQMESAELPASLRHETQMVLDELTAVPKLINCCNSAGRESGGSGGERCSLGAGGGERCEGAAHERRIAGSRSNYGCRSRMWCGERGRWPTTSLQPCAERH